ncbi:hypothetical protein BS78_05G252000 [Paspalum vaginatum]|nr:hypothetical protein BS78_05G252000 [Paspalum vaginatum]
MKRVLRFSDILSHSQLQQTGMLDDNPAMASALEDLEETLERALELVTACQGRSTIRRLVTARELSRQLRGVKDDILNQAMLALFAINTHTTVLLNTIRISVHGGALTRQPEDHFRMQYRWSWRYPIAAIQLGMLDVNMTARKSTYQQDVMPSLLP